MKWQVSDDKMTALVVQRKVKFVAGVRCKACCFGPKEERDNCDKMNCHCFGADREDGKNGHFEEVQA